MTFTAEEVETATDGEGEPEAQATLQTRSPDHRLAGESLAAERRQLEAVDELF